MKNRKSGRIQRAYRFREEVQQYLAEDMSTDSIDDVINFLEDSGRYKD